MPQNNVPVATVRPIRSSPLQSVITLQTPGSMVNVGAPGGPVVFASNGGLILTQIAGSPTRGVAGPRTPNSNSGA